MIWSGKALSIRTTAAQLSVAKVAKAVSDMRNRGSSRCCDRRGRDEVAAGVGFGQAGKEVAQAGERMAARSEEAEGAGRSDGRKS